MVQRYLGDLLNKVHARSTMEYDSIALDKAGKEAEWLRHFLEDIPMWSQPCHLSIFIAIVNQQLERRRIKYRTVSLGIFVEGIIP